MRQSRPIRTAALSRHQAPAFILCAGLELMQLRKLPWLARALYFELLALADHATGRIATSYAVLAALLDYDQAPTSHTGDEPTLQRIRTALDALVALRLVSVDRIANEKRKGLFLRVQSRAGISAPSDNRNRQSNRPAPAKKQAKSTACAPEPRKEQQTEQQGVQEVIPSPTPSLSTGAPRGMQAARDLVARMRRGAGGQAGPPGGQSIAPAAHAPQGLRPSKSAQADFSPAGNSHQQTDERATPAAGHQAHALATAPPAPAAGLLRGEPGNGLSDHSTSEARQGPRQAPQAPDEPAATPRPHPA